ncbi:MAG: GGDEF domain-containing protein [Acidobacteriota bacterium]
MSPHLKLSCILAAIMVGPSLAAMTLLEAGKASPALALLALHAALGLALLPFLAKAILRFVVYRELEELSVFSARLRRGGLPEPFALPVEAEDEHMLIRLKRNLNWMLHLLEDREKRLLWRLEETDKMRRDMEDLSRRDPLTGLGNRRAFEDALAHAGPSSLHERHLLLIDCDKFKQVNDSHGHQAGDEVLLVLAGILQDSVREGVDQAFRLGGDEFAVLLGCRELKARDVAERIRMRFRDVNGRGCTLSIGLAPLCPVNGSCGAARGGVVARADNALYDAKGSGGNRVSLRSSPQPL